MVNVLDFRAEDLDFDPSPGYGDCTLQAGTLHIRIPLHPGVTMTVLLTVFRYTVYRVVMVETTKSAKNIWEHENIIILGFLMAYNSSKRHIFKIYIFCKYVTF